MSNGRGHLQQAGSFDAGETIGSRSMRRSEDAGEAICRRPGRLVRGHLQQADVNTCMYVEAKASRPESRPKIYEDPNQCAGPKSRPS